MPDSIKTQITTDAAKAKSTDTDGTRIDRRSVSELVEADHHLATGTGIKKATRGLRFNKLSPPGTA